MSHDHAHAPGCACCGPRSAAAPSFAMPVDADPLDQAVAHAKQRQWRETAALLAPFAERALAGAPVAEGGAMEPQRVALTLRLSAAAEEQLGNNDRAGDIWEAFFRSAAPSHAAAVLADHLNLVRVRAKAGRLDAAARRRFVAKLAEAGRDGAIPRDLFLKLAGIFRGLSGRAHWVAGEAEAAFETLGRALWHIKRHNRLFQNDRADIAEFHACLREAADASGAALWRGRAVETLSVESWSGKA